MLQTSYSCFYLSVAFWLFIFFSSAYCTYSNVTLYCKLNYRVNIFIMQKKLLWKLSFSSAGYFHYVRASWVRSTHFWVSWDFPGSTEKLRSVETKFQSKKKNFEKHQISHDRKTIPLLIKCFLNGFLPILFFYTFSQIISLLYLAQPHRWPWEEVDSDNNNCLSLRFFRLTHLTPTCVRRDAYARRPSPWISISVSGQWSNARTACPNKGRVLSESSFLCNTRSAQLVIKRVTGHSVCVCVNARWCRLQNAKGERQIGTNKRQHLT